jgi:drug/metabolite transporter (DMT)-like permease
VTAIALALGAGLLWGVGDFLGGVSSRRLPTLTVLAYSELAGWLVVVVVVAATRPSLPSVTAAGAAVLAGIGGVVGLGGLYRGMAVGAMSVVAPISSAAAVIPVAVGLARGERPGALQLVGIAFALTGVVLVSREPGHAGARLAAGAGLALVAAIGFGSYVVFIDVASEDGIAWALLVSRGVATGLALLVAAGRSALRPPARSLPALVAVGLFDVSANGLLALALNEGLVSTVSVLASLYPVSTLTLAYLLLHERIGKVQAAGAAVALAGVALISAGT